MSAYPQWLSDFYNSVSFTRKKFLLVWASEEKKKILLVNRVLFFCSQNLITTIIFSQQALPLTEESLGNWLDQRCFL